jgi:hypothetical protein
MIKFFTSVFLIISTFSFAQKSNVSDQEALQQLYQQFRTKEIQDSILAAQLESQGKARVFEITDEKSVIGLVGFTATGFPIFYSTDNQNASATVGTNLVVAGATNGYGLTGNGMVIGEWDGGEVRGTHQELTGRVTQVDSPSSQSDHSTHVAGTMIASGVDASAKGMATAATISAHDFYSDDSEMTTFAGTGIISNHSYGTITGWRYMSSTTSWRWYGDTTISAVEDHQFGFYTYRARGWDLIANAAPNYLIVKSAGNDRNDVPGSSVTSHEIWDNTQGWITSTVSRPADGGVLGYDCISSNGNAKNILTVGAVEDIVGGYSQASNVVMSSFSGWGPTDDGRIKPDIVANGVSLYSTGMANNSDYYSSSGTSMSAPNATGSMALLQEMYNDSNASYMNASSLKALVIHTANESGANPGPDFKFGWGLLNIKGAADIIADTLTNKIIETSISNSGTSTYTFSSNGLQDIVATIVWNDPAATPVASSLDPTNSMLVNDLDLRISNSSGTVKMPWTLNSATPASAAVKADNVKDNVEKVIFDSPSAGIYTFTISHKGTLAATQNFSLVISGVIPTPLNPAPSPDFTALPLSICVGDSVQFTNATTTPAGTTSTYEWTFTGGTPTTSTNVDPLIQYNTAGIYAVKLKATNANGSDSLSRTNYITVVALPTPTTQSLSDACISGGTVTLSGGLPTGGTWTGNGVAAGIFDPSIAGLGTHTLTYTFTNSNGCIGSTTETITVTPAPTVNLPNMPTAICMTSAPFPLGGGTPIGGTYSGPGVTNNIFNASVAGAGSHTITYNYSDSAGCSGVATSTLVVSVGTTASLGAFNDVCIDAGVITLSGGTPMGGSYTGPGVDTTAGTFNPTLAGAGTHTITYFGLGGVCFSAATSTITVNALPTVALASFTDECVSANSLTLTGGTPTGGTYSGTSVIAGIFNASTAGLGTHSIYYNYTDANSCSSLDSNQINVVNSVAYSMRDTTICEGTTAFSLSSGLPMGGTYVGTGITGNTFDPIIAGPGVHVITYTDAANNCAVAATANITVTALPTVSLSPFNTICVTGGNDTLSGGTPTGGTYSGTGITNNILDPTVNGAGTMVITYTVMANGCSNAATQTVTIGMGTPLITNISTAYCLNENSVVLIGDPVGGIFSGSGITGSTFDPNSAGVGLHTITYTTTGGCAGSSSYDVMINPKPTIGVINGPMISSQNIVAAYYLNAQNGMYYSWIATGGSITTNSNNQITVRWDSNSTGDLQAVIHDQNGCKDTTNITVNLWPVNVNEVSESSNIKFYPNPVSDVISFTGNLPQKGMAELLIINLSGQEIQKELKMINKTDFNWSINVSDILPGSYIFKIQMNNSVVSTGQFVKQ